MTASAQPESAPQLSLIIPAFNEATRIGDTLQRCDGYFANEKIDAEILVVDDGSTDGTREVARAACPHARVLEYGRNRGKGYAVRTGVLASTGALVLFSDADLSTPIEEVRKLQAALDGGADVAIGSRALDGSDLQVRQPLPRELMGRGFNVLVQMFVMQGIRDTQCGFKLMPGALARSLFAEVRLDGFAFDVELLWLARRRRLRIDEVPVVWRHAEASKVSPVTDAARMFVDLLRIRALHWLDR